MERETGLVLMIVGVWLIVASAAGGLAARVLSMAPGGGILVEGGSG